MPLETQHLTLSEGLGGPDTKGPRGNSREERSIWLVSWPSPLPVAMLRGQGRFRLGIRQRPGSPPTQCVRVSQSDYSHGVHPRATLQPCRLCPCQSIPGQGQREACGGRRGTLRVGGIIQCGDQFNGRSEEGETRVLRWQLWRLFSPIGLSSDSGLSV